MVLLDGFPWKQRTVLHLLFIQLLRDGRLCCLVDKTGNIKTKNLQMRGILVIHGHHKADSTQVHTLNIADVKCTCTVFAFVCIQYTTRHV